MEKFTISRMEMGSAFRKRRKMLGITSTSLSEKTGVLETRICQHETGGSPIKQFELVKKIAKAKGISDVNFVEYLKNSLFYDIFSVNKQQNSMMNFIPESMKYGRKPLYLWE